MAVWLWETCVIFCTPLCEASQCTAYVWLLLLLFSGWKWWLFVNFVPFVFMYTPAFLDTESPPALVFCDVDICIDICLLLALMSTCDLCIDISSWQLMAVLYPGFWQCHRTAWLDLGIIFIHLFSLLQLSQAAHILDWLFCFAWWASSSIYISFLLSPLSCSWFSTTVHLM